MDVLTNKEVLTRKKHSCTGCANVYPERTKMRYIVSVDQGDFSGYYLCKTCQTVLDEDWDVNDEFCFGSVKSNDEERWLEVQERLSETSRTT